MIADAFDGDWPVSQPWLNHDVAAEPFDSRYPDFPHTHPGIDIAMPTGTGLYAVGPGTVGMVAYATLQLHLDEGVDVWFFHIDSAQVRSGDRVTKNQRVATSGGKVPGGGASTGPHLHYEVRPAGVPYQPPNNSLDPVPYLDFAEKRAAAAPAAAVVGPGQFVATISADGGAWAHSSPSLDPTTRVDLIDKGAAVVFNGWCHAGPMVAAIPDARTNQPGDDRMFRSAARGLWIASAMVLGVPGNGAPELPGVGTIPVPTPIPVAPAVPFTGDPLVLVGKWFWEFTDQGDYAALKALGADGVIIRAYNGDGGATAQAQLAMWQARSAAARAAGLKAVAWTYWYGPGEPGYTETDPSAYLLGCARATALLQVDTPAWVIDAEAHSMDGLAQACA
ncbi:MAG: M23 family metallopeptidase, partial [Actinomycetota bacterium]|nr:M23 family metallopeptidase [Actinomycetota bacterium]